MISAVILTHNNEDSIEKILESLMWCGERIIIDDGSTDKTPDLVKKYDVRVFKHSVDDDFAAQRNFGLSKAKGDWVLFVDSDEIVSQGLQQEIASKLTDESDISGYYLRRVDVLWGTVLTHGEVGRVRLLRLAKKGKGNWMRPVHETWQIKGKTGEFAEALLHYPHPDVAQFISDIDRYSRLNALFFHSQGKRTNLFEIVSYPAGKFFQNYVLRRGYLDGTAGAVVALTMSFHSFLTRARLYFLSHGKKDRV